MLRCEASTFWHTAPCGFGRAILNRHRTRNYWYRFFLDGRLKEMYPHWRLVTHRFTCTWRTNAHLIILFVVLPQTVPQPHCRCCPPTWRGSRLCLVTLLYCYLAELWRATERCTVSGCHSSVHLILFTKDIPAIMMISKRMCHNWFAVYAPYSSRAFWSKETFSTVTPIWGTIPQNGKKANDLDFTAKYSSIRMLASPIVWDPDNITFNRNPRDESCYAKNGIWSLSGKPKKVSEHSFYLSFHRFHSPIADLKFITCLSIVRLEL